MNYTSDQRPPEVLVTDYAWKSLDIEKEILKKVGVSVVAAPTGAEDELVELATNVDGILTCWKSVTEKIIRNASRCQAICRYGIGLDNIDVGCATQMGILVTNVPAYCIEEVSDHAMALLLSLARKVGFFNQSIKAGSYDLKRGIPLYRLKGKTLGIAGFGKIGRRVHQKASGFGLKILVYDRGLETKSLGNHDVEWVNFVDLLKRSDYITIHLPLTANTRHLFNLEAFRQMKRTAFVINTSRGGVVDPSGLLQALDEGLIAGAALDVLAKEPPDPNDALIVHPKTVITPHAGFYSEESLLELQETAAQQMADIISGKLPNSIINPTVLSQPNLRARIVGTNQQRS